MAAPITHLVKFKKKYGTSIPRSIAIALQGEKTLKRATISRLTKPKTIDIYRGVQSHHTGTVNNRSAVKELVFAENTLIVVCYSGLARAYVLATTRFLCELNPQPYYEVQTIVYNKNNRTIIVAFSPTPGLLKCKILEAEELHQGRLTSSSSGRNFESLTLMHPAFFEFDDNNCRISAANLSEQTYSFWDMSTYNRVFDIKGESYEEIRVSDGLITLFKTPAPNGVAVSMFDIHDGTRLTSDTMVPTHQRPMIFLELCREHLLFKQEGASLRIVDLLRGETQKIQGMRDFSPLGFIFLADQPKISQSKPYLQTGSKQFLTVSSGILQLWEIFNCSLTCCKTIKLPGITSPDNVSCSINCRLAAAFSSKKRDSVKIGFQTAKQFLQKNIRTLFNGDDETLEFLDGCVAPSKRQLSDSPSLQVIDLNDGDIIATISNEILENDSEFTSIHFAPEHQVIGFGSASGNVTLLTLPDILDVKRTTKAAFPSLLRLSEFKQKKRRGNLLPAGNLKPRRLNVDG